MANPLFRNKSQSNNANPLSNMINQVRSQGPSATLFNQMYNSNPQFRQFADSMKNKTPEQAFMENGLNFDDFKNYRW